jgi:hypothetical protein
MQFATGEMANEDRIFDEKCEGKKEATWKGRCRDEDNI